MRGFDDFTVGEAGELGSIEVTAEAIVAFAREFDPQPFHLDPEAGLASPLGGHAASGWHTVSLLMRLMVDGLLGATRSMGSPGVRDLKWLRPVLAGDRLTARYEILGAKPSTKRGDRGYVDGFFEMANQHGERVCCFAATIIVGRG